MKILKKIYGGKAASKSDEEIYDNGSAWIIDPVLRESLLSFAFQQLRDWEDAQDVVSETLIKVREKFDPHHESGADIRTYAFKVCRNLCLKWHGRRGRDNVSLDELPEDLFQGWTSDSPLENLVQQERRELYLVAAQELSPRLREICQLRCIEELRLAEIAARLGTKTSTVKFQLYRAKRKLKEMLLIRTSD